MKFKKREMSNTAPGNNLCAPGRTVGSSSAEKDLSELVYNRADYKPTKLSYDKAASWIP